MLNVMLQGLNAHCLSERFEQNERDYSMSPQPGPAHAKALPEGQGALVAQQSA